MPVDNVYCISFNGKQDTFAIGSDSGIRIIKVVPLQEIKNFGVDEVGSVTIVRLLNKTNLLGIVSGGKFPKFAGNAALIFDAFNRKFVVEITVNSLVTNFAFSYSKLIVAQAKHITVFSFPNNLQKLRCEELAEHCNGLFAFNADPKAEYLVYPGRTIGSVHIVNLLTTNQTSCPAPLIINAHKNRIARVAINNLGTMIATGSTQGTLIHIYNAKNGEKLFELRRGMDTVSLRCLRFSPCSNYLLASSNKGTIHIFSVTTKRNESHKSLADLLNKDERRSISRITLKKGEEDSECVFINNCMPSASHKSNILNNCNDDIISVSTKPCLTHFSGTNGEIKDYVDLSELGDNHDFWTTPI
ncbi:WD repeat domain phosphoinositide-interacting protein 4 [Strongyloides ratti]|uniref:WD repeat domain phosphoinositide-interacting protein 4 n=1 Tax=Strongyloides ratti TaxID=34506 RepID=A0A090LRB4_STRRB|nr:WD repeat domain phosphoinositide-interacting protein 4 [Strongyloides ratti]CEF70687.1 WD repeat domain phosphoinositide-interacting protein 4 [Strongyloides ratti]